MPKLIYDKRDRIAYLTIDRPEARNAIDREVPLAMVDAWADSATTSRSMWRSYRCRRRGLSAPAPT
jgi:enoyl-CoA hydratase/carnithine racemase